jgi:hypothetical protein
VGGGSIVGGVSTFTHGVRISKVVTPPAPTTFWDICSSPPKGLNRFTSIYDSNAIAGADGSLGCPTHGSGPLYTGQRPFSSLEGCCCLFRCGCRSCGMGYMTHLHQEHILHIVKLQLDPRFLHRTTMLLSIGERIVRTPVPPPPNPAPKRTLQPREWPLCAAR